MERGVGIPLGLTGRMSEHEISISLQLCVLPFFTSEKREREKEMEEERVLQVWLRFRGMERSGGI